MLKNKPLGIKLISLLLCLPVILYWLFVFALHSYTQMMTNLPEASKKEMVQSGHLKRIHIYTEQDFDNYVASLNQSSKDLPNPGLIWSMVPLLLALGIITLSWWARWGVILYAGVLLLTSLVWFLPGTKASAVSLLSKIFSVPIDTFFIVYLTLPKVKKLFE